MKTVNADATLVNDLPPVTQKPEVASIINIPPQISTTVCWLVAGAALGFALCWWATKPNRRTQGSDRHY